MIRTFLVARKLSSNRIIQHPCPFAEVHAGRGEGGFVRPELAQEEAIRKRGMGVLVDGIWKHRRKDHPETPDVPIGADDDKAGLRRDAIELLQRLNMFPGIARLVLDADFVFRDPHGDGKASHQLPLMLGGTDLTPAGTGLVAGPLHDEDGLREARMELGRGGDSLGGAVVEDILL